MSGPHKERDLRDARDDLTRRHVEQARETGRTPDLRQIERRAQESVRRVDRRNNDRGGR